MIRWSVLTAIVISAIVARVYLISVYRVNDVAISPELVPGDFVFGWKTTVLPLLIQRNDIVEIRLPDGATKLRRVLGAPGDKIEEADENKMVVNDSVVTAPQQSKLVETIIVPPSQLYVTADAQDSLTKTTAALGLVEMKNVASRLSIIWFSWHRTTGIKWERIGKTVGSTQEGQ